MARAILSVVRQQGKATSGVYRGLSYVHITGQGLDISVLGEDWEKILPFIQDGSFDPALVPVSARVGYLHPERHYDAPTLDTQDVLFYERVLSILQDIFTDDYPTSDL